MEWKKETQLRPEDGRRLQWSESRKFVQKQRWEHYVPESFQDMDLGSWKDGCVDDTESVWLLRQQCYQFTALTFERFYI